MTSYGKEELIIKCSVDIFPDSTSMAKVSKTPKKRFESVSKIIHFPEFVSYHNLETLRFSEQGKSGPGFPLIV